MMYLNQLSVVSSMKKYLYVQASFINWKHPINRFKFHFASFIIFFIMANDEK